MKILHSVASIVVQTTLCTFVAAVILVGVLQRIPGALLLASRPRPVLTVSVTTVDPVQSS